MAMLMIGSVLYLTFEAPIQAIENYITKRRKTKQFEAAKNI